MSILSTLTTLVNLVAMAASVWLGFYIVTRSIKTLLSWLATLTVWSLAGYFLHNAIAINLPGSAILTWLRQTVIVVLPLWLHLSWLLAPRPEAQNPRATLARINRVGMPLAYGITAALIAIGLFTRELLSDVETGSALYTTSRTPGIAYPVFIAFLVVVSLLTLINLWRGRDLTRSTTVGGQFNSLLLATVLAGLGGLYIATGTEFQIALPTFPGDLGLGTGVILLGYAVARYAAVLEGRPIDRDFLYTLLVVGSLTAFYVLVVYVLFLAGQVSFLTLVLTIVGTIAANSLFDGVRLTLDRIFYRRQFQELRSNLRALASEAGTGQTLAEHLQAILDALCRTYRIKQGLITLREGDRFVVRATRDAHALGQAFPISALTAIEIMGLVRAAKQGLEGMTLLVPLDVSGNQIGALVLGPKESIQTYTEQELELLDDLGGQIASIVHTQSLQEENARALNRMVEEFRERERLLNLQVQQVMVEREERTGPAPGDVGEDELERQVEDGLRHLHDLPYLGEHALARLRVVEQQVAIRGASPATFIERGKAVSQVLLQALDKLRPAGKEPESQQVPTREWHGFIILHDSYVRDEPNRNVMSRLYISEGTFNRTRRRALRAVAKALGEMEQEARRRES